MKLHVAKDHFELGEAAGKTAANLIVQAIEEKGFANIILATGTSQFETIRQLIESKEIDWSKVNMFHLDEYIDLPLSHPASFRKYLKERFLDKVAPLGSATLINGEGDVAEECARLNAIIKEHPIDVALVGIGENGHLAFNDPPADFDIEDPYIVVTLDTNCRNQQLGEGWFNGLEEVPKQAISMSIKQICKSSKIICSVPDLRKAQGVKDSLEQPVSNLYPSSILQEHPDCAFYLDEDSASLLSEATLQRA
jgi:glucosamine-6-phosphate deaminase